MASDLSPENEQFIAAGIEAGQFMTRTEALDQAVELLRLRERLVPYVQAGVRQLQTGEHRTYTPEGLEQRFDELAQRIERRLADRPGDP